MILKEAVSLISDLQRTVLCLLGAGSQTAIGNDRLLSLADRMGSTKHPGLVRLASLAERVHDAENITDAAGWLFDLHLALTEFRANTATTGELGGAPVVSFSQE